MPKKANKPRPVRRHDAPKAIHVKHVLPDTATSNERVCWRFRHVDHDGPWGFDKVTPDALCEILMKLADFESMTVNELFNQNEEPGKDYAVEAIPNKEALKRLEAIGQPDATQISRLRLQGMQRLYGFRYECVSRRVVGSETSDLAIAEKGHLTYRASWATLGRAAAASACGRGSFQPHYQKSCTSSMRSVDGYRRPRAGRGFDFTQAMCRPAIASPIGTIGNGEETRPAPEGTAWRANARKTYRRTRHDDGEPSSLWARSTAFISATSASVTDW